MKTYLMITTALLMLFGAVACEDSDTPDPVPTLSADLPKASERWKGMTEDEQAAVCAAASGPLPGEGEVGGGGTEIPLPGETPSVDYRMMLDAIEDAGFTQPEAAAMIPYALNECR